ncbi:hypothetical protein [Pedobacter hartonius]|nr:hypothetical protein [Pedobacter hartonius]
MIVALKEKEQATNNEKHSNPAGLQHFAQEFVLIRLRKRNPVNQMTNGIS